MEIRREQILIKFRNIYKYAEIKARKRIYKFKCVCVCVCICEKEKENDRERVGHQFICGNFVIELKWLSCLVDA